MSSMGFKDSLVKNVISPHTSQMFSNSIGKVVSYDEIHNKADVLVSSSGAFTTLEGVPIQLSGRGIMTSKVQVDDLVYIQYNNGSVFQPKIVGFADEDYSNKTRENSRHLRKGSLLSTFEEKEGELKPSAYRRIDNDSDSFKHSEYRELSAIDAIGEKIESLGYFNNQELGLFHPVLSSLIKLKDDGDIDIFTGTNVGLRINRKKRTIEFFGDNSSICEDWKVLSNYVTVIAQDSVNIECKKLNLDAEEIYVNKERLNV